MAELRVRREPPPFRTVEVRRTEAVTPHLVRVVLAGPELDGLDPGLPAASVRLLLPSPGADLVLPAWNGNEFLLPDGTRPILRTLTPRRFDPQALELTIEVVIHDGGPLAAWAAAAAQGAAAAISGTGRGYPVDPDADAFLLVGDETAVPAISQLLEAIRPDARVDVELEIGHADAAFELPAHPGATVRWHLGPVLDAVRRADIGPGTRVWAAGEAAAMQRIRRLLFDERELPRSAAVVRGYWKRGRAGDDGDG